ncbi:MAG: response regulator transcription factor [Synechococcales cyanobacterium]
MPPDPMNPGNAIHMVVVDDHPLFLEGVVQTLGSEPDIEVVAQGSSAEEAIRLSQEYLPDILLLDWGIPGTGLAAAKAVAAACPVTRIVILTASEEEEHLLAALRVGAKAYILKGVAARELVRILRGVFLGEVYVTPTLAASLLVDMTGSPPKDPLHALTEREHQILYCVAAGRSNKEIAQELFLSEKTIKHYMSNILQKLQVRNRVEAALLAQKHNLGTPHAP